MKALLLIAVLMVLRPGKDITNVLFIKDAFLITILHLCVLHDTVKELCGVQVYAGWGVGWMLLVSGSSFQVDSNHQYATTDPST